MKINICNFWHWKLGGKFSLIFEFVVPISRLMSAKSFLLTWPATGQQSWPTPSESN